MLVRSCFLLRTIFACAFFCKKMHMRIDNMCSDKSFIWEPLNMKKNANDTQIDGQMSIFDLLNIPSDLYKTYSPSEINAVVVKLIDEQKRAEQREK